MITRHWPNITNVAPIRYNKNTQHTVHHEHTCKYRARQWSICRSVRTLSMINNITHISTSFDDIEEGEQPCRSRHACLRTQIFSNEINNTCLCASTQWSREKITAILLRTLWNYLRERNLLYYDSNFIEICSQKSNCQLDSIGLDNCWALIGWLIFIWKFDGLS